MRYLIKLIQIKIRNHPKQQKFKPKMQTAPTSPTFRNAPNQASTVKFKNTKEIEYKSFIKKEEKKVRK